PEAEIVALVNRSDVPLPAELQSCPLFNDFDAALQATKPDLAVIATYSDSHADYACRAMEAGAHVFVEKPLATTVADARRVVDCARATGRKLVVGYILRHHPSWQRLIAEARALGGPYVFRLNLNQQSTGPTWETHKSLMRTTPPIVDCGVHYVDVMCQITDARPVRVHGMGLRLSDEIAEDMYNYGQFQVVFEDG
ncbi:MAG: Gfo/Idh/MocA family oxidoreductase, partial [Rhodobacteraceae bacterium]|nr:Gfo/Idh/MocA family oxidoreductase [Paracoccaceae bacterium]